MLKNFKEKKSERRYTDYKCLPARHLVALPDNTLCTQQAKEAKQA